MLRLSPQAIVKLDRRYGENGIGIQISDHGNVKMEDIQGVIDSLSWTLPEA